MLSNIAKRIGGPILLYIALAGLLGMGGTFVYVKYLKNKNLNLLESVSKLSDSLLQSEGSNKVLRAEIDNLDKLLAIQRKTYKSIDKDTTKTIKEILNDEEDIPDYIDKSELNKLQQW